MFPPHCDSDRSSCFIRDGDCLSILRAASLQINSADSGNFHDNANNIDGGVRKCILDKIDLSEAKTITLNVLVVAALLDLGFVAKC